jgi:hypothetical protein
MKIKSLMLLVLALSFPFVASADPVTPLVQSEYAKLQAEFQSEMAKSKKTLVDLAQKKSRALSAVEAQTRLENGGIEQLKRYDIVITSRYVNENGEYQSGMEINQKDVENINQMFETYMHSAPLFGRVSAGHARRTIEWGITRLQELAKLHGNPTEENNSELEIIAKQTRDAETTIHTVTALAGRLGVSLTTPVAQVPVEPKRSVDPKKLDQLVGGSRTPASRTEE